MLQIVYRIPGLNIPIYGYGLMMVLTFLATQWLSTRMARSRGFDPDIFVNVAVIALFAGVVGSRASHVLENLPDYTRSDLSIGQNLFNMINLRAGGLTFYGGLILASPVVLAYTLMKKVPARVTMDIVAPCITLGLAIGRIGCFLNGCCYGAATTVPWAVQFPYYSDAYVDQYNDDTLNHPVPPQLLEPAPTGLRLRSPDSFRNNPDLVALARREKANPVHPAEIYSTITSLLNTGVLLVYFTLPHVPGRGFAMMLILEGPTRFLLEMLRVEPPVLGPFSFSMVLGALLFVVGIALWFILKLPRPFRPVVEPALR